ncbi:MAG: hypothetical protein ACREL7_03920 [Longimicrobiales bacterium]
MKEKQGSESTAGYTALEGLSLTLGYLDDPSSIDCPSCGPGRIEVLAYVDPTALSAGTIHHIDPDEDYSVLLRCHGCERSAALHLTYRERRENREAA